MNAPTLHIYSRGFTLVELLIYMALLTLMLSALFTLSTALEDTASYIQTVAARLHRSIDADHKADEGIHVMQ